MPGNEPRFSRRTALKAAGVTAAVGAGARAVTTAGAAESDSAWEEVPTPTGKTLTDVVHTTAGHVAVGESGDVLIRSGGEWQLAFDSGPNAANNPLFAVDVTDDGERVWMCGGSGALGAFDVTTGVKSDYTAPDGMTSTWEGIAVTGAAGDERLVVANDVGETFDGRHDADGCAVWGEAVVPGSGTTIAAADYTEDGEQCYVVDTATEVHRTADHNDTWETVGIDGADGTLTDVHVVDDTAHATAEAGMLYRYKADDDEWTAVDVAGRILYAVDRHSHDLLLSASGGYVYERVDDSWSEMATPVDEDLLGVAYGGSVDVAVGSTGTVVERA